MADPPEEELDPLFRDQAVAWAGGRRLGDVARLESVVTARLFQVLLVGLIGLVVGGLGVRVPVTTEGTVVVDEEHGLVTALFAEPLQVRPGHSLTVYVDGSTRARTVTIVAVSPTTDQEVMVTASVPSRDAPTRGGRAYVSTGSTSLLGFVVRLP